MALQLQSPLLRLPGEMRDDIWKYSAANGTWYDLILCCKQIRDEMKQHCHLPDDLEELHLLSVIVDSTSEPGRWLEFCCVWDDGCKRRTLKVRETFMNRPELLFIDHLEIKLICPTSDNSPVTFFTMLAKFRNLCTWGCMWFPTIQDVSIHYEMDTGSEVPSECFFWTSKIGLDSVQGFPMVSNWCYYEYFISGLFDIVADLVPQHVSVFMHPLLQASPPALQYKQAFQGVMEDGFGEEVDEASKEALGRVCSKWENVKEDMAEFLNAFRPKEW